MTKPEVGASNDSWGDKTNVNWDLLDAALWAIAIVANGASTAAAGALPATSYTAADVLAKLVTVDGTGSGLDADKLDGNEAAAFLLAASYTAADILAKLLTVDGTGSGLDADLLAGQAATYYTNIAARLGFTPANKAGDTFGGAVTITGNLTVSGTGTFGGDITSSSDERLKTDIADLDGDAMLRALAAIGGQSFTMGGVARMGVIAQRVQAAGLGALVQTAGDHLAVSYGGMVGPLIAAVVRLEQRVAQLEARG
jgi:hypothetical protein